MTDLFDSIEDCGLNDWCCLFDGHLRPCARPAAPAEPEPDLRALMEVIQKDYVDRAERPAGLDVERLAAVINDGIRNGRSDHEIARDVLALAARLSETPDDPERLRKRLADRGYRLVP